MASESEYDSDIDIMEYSDGLVESDCIQSESDNDNSEGNETDSDEIIAPVKRSNVTCDSSECSDSEAENSNENSEWTQIAMDNDSSVHLSHLFTESPGPRHMPSSASKPIDYFYLFFTMELFSLMVKETNRYARAFLNSNQEMLPHARARVWRPVTVTEMKAFTAVLLEMGITRRPNIASYWTKNSRYIPWFGSMFSRNRFQSILRFFHLIDNRNVFPPGHSSYNPCIKFDPLVQHANRMFRYYYTPQKALSIDESLVGTKCHSSITQYLPNKKHHRWGIKFWMLCDSVTNYCLGFYCYRGANYEKDKEEIKKFGLGYLVVTKLLALGNYLNRGYHIFVDNFFSSIYLARYLYKNQTYFTGTIRSNRKGIPHAIKSVDVGQAKYFRNSEVLLCGYREKKNKKMPVLLLSTKSVAKNVTTTKKRRNQNIQKIKPEIVADYNKFMGGVDGSDMMLYTYLDERRTVKFWKKVAFNIFGRMVLNAFIIFKETTTGNKMSRLEFTSSIINAIEMEWLLEKKQEPVKIQHDIGLEKLPGRNMRRCAVCSNKDGGPIKRSRLICSMCKKGLHGLCLKEHKCM